MGLSSFSTWAALAMDPQLAGELLIAQLELVTIKPIKANDPQKQQW